MKIIVLGIGAFGYAILRHISNNHKDKTFYAYEINTEVLNHIKENKSHPYFFEGYSLGENIKYVEDLKGIIPEMDLVISVIPCQFATKAIEAIKDYLKPGVTILNLAKGINNQTLETIGDSLERVLKVVDYNYAELSGGMIASEFVEGKKLGADIAVENKELGVKLKNLFKSSELDINLINSGVKNIELYGALKNVVAICIGYYEGKGNDVSTLSYYFCKLYNEFKELIILLGGDNNINFSDYALGGDLITTCFGKSRNRYFGNLIGKGNSLEKTLEIFKKENKIAEGYETMKGVYKLIENKDGFKEIKKVYKKVLEK